MGGSCSKSKNGDIDIGFGDGRKGTRREDSESTGVDCAPSAAAVPSRSPPPENKTALSKPRVVPLAPPVVVTKSPSKPSETFQSPVPSTAAVEPKQAAVIAAAAKITPPPSAPKPPQLLDDNDFSVPPSLDFECRSIVKMKFDDIYTRGRKLGFGAFAEVFVGKHKPTGTEYAVKQIDRSKMFWGDRDALKDEIGNLKDLRQGPNITQLYEYFEVDTYCYLVMELLLGGELFDKILDMKTFTETEARNCCQCVLSALDYMHERRVAHRDLKPENLLLADRNALLPVKLADFGFTKHVTQTNGLHTFCGTPGYLAPEILERRPAYDTKCDMWSVGVILFLLLGGYLPFDDEDDDKVLDRTRNGQYYFRPRFWRNVSMGAKDLVSQCLTINPSKRVSAAKALKHDWMHVKEEELNQHKLDVDRLKRLIQAKRKMKAAVDTFVAANRLQNLHKRRRKDSVVSHISTMTGGTSRMTTAANFKEDRPTGNPFQAFYDVGELLGEGGYAKVYQCKRKSSQLTYAVKEITISKLEEYEDDQGDGDDGVLTLKDEITALRLRGGPYIILLFDVFESDPDTTYLVLEEMRAGGNDLLSRIMFVEKEVYTEREATQVCKIIFQAIDYCHKQHMAEHHHHVKPENLLLEGDADVWSFFGISRWI